MINLSKAPNKTEYIATLGDEDKRYDTSVLLGGNDTKNFLPNVNASKWKDEAFLNFNPRFMKVTSASVFKFDNGVTEIQCGGVKFRTWVLGESVLEFALMYSSRPLKYYIDIDVSHSKNINWHFQPTLTEQQVANKVDRPLNVVGSYALYIDKSNNEYRTGKFGLVYRFEVIDANGNRALCDENYFDGQKLIIGLPKAFVDKCTLPFVVMGAGDTIGFNAEGDSSDGYYSDYWMGGLFASTGAGGTPWTVKIFNKILSINTVDTNIGIYEDDGTVPGSNPDGATKKNTTDATFQTTTALAKGWRTATGLVCPTLSAATDYWLIWHAGGTDTSRYYDTTGGVGAFKPGTYAPLPNPAPSSLTLSNDKFSVYIDYTAAGGLSIPIAIHHLRQAGGL